ncbi:hypothetical protein GGR50DRAFT_157068 [Xylaria sp. CBS 124048]|nr:hypothetical protein GGR50DRAFT_157068 [Xylaria sp. CBS 124048]
MATRVAGRARTPSPSRLPLPESPTYSCVSTANPPSTFNLPLPPPPRPAHTVLTKADLEQSHLAYSDLLATAKSYRLALASLSTAASSFGSALEACARLKESRADSLLHTPDGISNNQTLSNSYSMKVTSCTADHLMSTSGVHYLIANHQQILSETVYRSFEVPLLDDLDKWRRDIEDAEEAYQNEVAVRSREIRRLEIEGLKLHRQRRRDLGKFREHLVNLTGKLDGLSALHGDHSQSLLRESQEASAKILEASCSLVRAEVDIFEGLARKGWSGGGLDELLERGRDLFAADEDAVTGTGGSGSAAGGATNDGTKLFSILPPKSILADTALDSGTKSPQPGQGHPRSDSFLSESDRYQSLSGAFTSQGDVDSIFSDFNQTRAMRPFSPQPIRRLATDVIMDPESLLHGDEEFRDRDARLDETEEINTEMTRENGERIPMPNGEKAETNHNGHDNGHDDDEHDDEYDEFGNERNGTIKPTTSPRKSIIAQELGESEDKNQTDQASSVNGVSNGEESEEQQQNNVDSPWKDEGVLIMPSATFMEDA